jgi:pimeloyl-ACP methyl ester carboxylesterase
MSVGWLEHAARHALRALWYDSRWIDTPVGPVHVLQREGGGTLPPVVMVHGLGAAAIHWVPLIRRLRPHVSRVITIDLPGHGFSVRPPELTEEVLTTGVLTALDAVHVEPGVVVGNSLGGLAAVRYVLARPERVLGTVLLSPAGAPMSDDEIAEVRRLFGVRTRADARAFFARLLARPPGALAGWFLERRLLQLLSDPALHGLLAAANHRELLSPDQVRSLPPRTTLVWGRKDRILPASAVPFWRAHLPEGAAVVEPDDVGHSPHLDDVGQTAAYVLDLARKA